MEKKEKDDENDEREEGDGEDEDNEEEAADVANAADDGEVKQAEEQPHHGPQNKLASRHGQFDTKLPGIGK